MWHPGSDAPNAWPWKIPVFFGYHLDRQRLFQCRLGKSWLRKFSAVHKWKELLLRLASSSCRPASQEHVRKRDEIFTSRSCISIDSLEGMEWVWHSQSSELKDAEIKYLGNVHPFRQEALQPWEIQYRVSKEGEDKQSLLALLAEHSHTAGGGKI